MSATAIEDPARLESLRTTGLLDTPVEEDFDRLTRLAVRLLRAPVAYVSLVDLNRQFFKSAVGLTGEWAEQRESPVSDSFCQHVVRTGEPLVIPDTRVHPLVRTSPAIAAQNALAYAGIPLVDTNGAVLGTFCVIDHRPHAWTEEEIESLQELAASATAEIQLRISARALEQAHRDQQFLAEAGAALASSLDYNATLDTVARLAVENVADYCAIDIAQEDGTFRRMAANHADPAKRYLVDIILAYPVTGDPGSPAAEVLRTGEAQLYTPDEPWLASIARDAAHLDAMRRLDARYLIIAPLLAREHLRGVLLLASSRPDRVYGARDVTLAMELARRAALAVDNARLYEKAQHAIRARDDILGIVSHDLRNPVGTALMAADLLLDLHAADERSTERRQIEIIRRSMQRANHLIADLLDVTRIEAGRLAVDPQPESAPAILCEAWEALLPVAEGASLTLDYQWDDDLPRILADRGRLVQALGNLVANAIKFTPAGGRITLGASHDGDGVRFSIADTGSGIDPEHLPHLFDRFWQADNRDRRGAGLGLAIVNGIVEAHGGRVRVESTPEVGSTFYLTVPAAHEAIMA